MKTAMIARFVLGAGAIFAVAGLAGCGAETGQGASEEIGSTSAALSVASKAAFTGSAVEGAAQCVIHGVIEDPNFPNDPTHDTARDFMLVAGGQLTPTPTYTNVAKLYDPVANAWYSAGTFGTAGTPGDERAFHQLTQIPGHSDECLLVGGLNTGGLLATTFRAKFTRGVNPGVTWSAENNLATARARFALSQCGTANIIAVSGGDGGTRVTSIEKWTYAALPTKGTWANLATMSDARYDFAFAADGTQQFAIAGGNSASAAGASTTVETLEVTAACALSHQMHSTIPGTFLTAARNLSVAFAKSSAATSHIYVAGGDTGAAVLSSIDDVSVTWGTSISVAAATGGGSTLPTAVRRPALVLTGSDVVLVGGEGHTGVAITGSSPNFNVQKFNLATPAWTSVALTDERTKNVAAFLNSKVYTTTGEDNTPTFLTSTEEITP